MRRRTVKSVWRETRPKRCQSVLQCLAREDGAGCPCAENIDQRWENAWSTHRRYHKTFESSTWWKRVKAAEWKESAARACPRPRLYTESETQVATEALYRGRSLSSPACSKRPRPPALGDGACRVPPRCPYVLRIVYMRT